MTRAIGAGRKRQYLDCDAMCLTDCRFRQMTNNYLLGNRQGVNPVRVQLIPRQEMLWIDRILGTIRIRNVLMAGGLFSRNAVACLSANIWCRVGRPRAASPPDHCGVGKNETSNVQLPWTRRHLGTSRKLPSLAYPPLLTFGGTGRERVPPAKRYQSKQACYSGHRVKARCCCTPLRPSTGAASWRGNCGKSHGLVLSLFDSFLLKVPSALLRTLQTNCHISSPLIYVVNIAFAELGGCFDRMQM